MTIDARPTLRAFDGLAAGYDRHRPHYPKAIIDAIVGTLDPRGVAVDIGCGTGISTRALGERIATVIGVDPSDDMLRRATDRCRDLSGVRFVRATAEATTLEDRSADLVLVAQAFHWCDPEAALDEFHRLLRPGGRCALLWNLRIADGGLTDRYNDIVVRDANALDPSTRAGRTTMAEPLRRSSLFRDAQVVTEPNPQRLDREGLIGRAVSASYFPRAEPARSERLRALDQAFDAFAVDGFVTLAQRAELTIATRR